MSIWKRSDPTLRRSSRRQWDPEPRLPTAKCKMMTTGFPYFNHDGRRSIPDHRFTRKKCTWFEWCINTSFIVQTLFIDEFYCQKPWSSCAPSHPEELGDDEISRILSCHLRRSSLAHFLWKRGGVSITTGQFYGITSNIYWWMISNANVLLKTVGFNTLSVPWYLW